MTLDFIPLVVQNHPKKQLVKDKDNIKLLKQAEAIRNKHGKNSKNPIKKPKGRGNRSNKSLLPGGLPGEF